MPTYIRYHVQARYFEWEKVTLKVLNTFYINMLIT